MTTRTFTETMGRLNRDDRPQHFHYCACGHSFDRHERMDDGRCEECHDTDAVVVFEEWDTVPLRDDVRRCRVR